MILFLGGALYINRRGQKISKRQVSDSALSLRLCGLKWSFILMKTAQLPSFINFEFSLNKPTSHCNPNNRGSLSGLVSRLSNAAYIYTEMVSFS